MIKMVHYPQKWKIHKINLKISEKLEKNNKVLSSAVDTLIRLRLNSTKLPERVHCNLLINTGKSYE